MVIYLLLYSIIHIQALCFTLYPLNYVIFFFLIRRMSWVDLAMLYLWNRVDLGNLKETKRNFEYISYNTAEQVFFFYIFLYSLRFLGNFGK